MTAGRQGSQPAATEAPIDRILSHVRGNVDGLIGVYLYGSSTTTGLKPESDVDLLMVTRRSLTSWERRSLVSVLLSVSGWKGHLSQYPEMAARRPIDLTSLVADEVVPLPIEPWRDFQFGEWLRNDFTRGIEPGRERDPDVVILLAAALASHHVLHGPPLSELVHDVPFEKLKAAQVAVLPELVDNLPGDERNVLLTLARALHTVVTGRIAPKSDAAELAVEHLNRAEAELLKSAAKEHLGEGSVDWNTNGEVAFNAAQSLRDLILQACAQR